MALNKEMLSTYFQYKDYDKCIEMLRKEIINYIVKKIQIKDPNYKYSSIRCLKDDSLKYLSESDQEIVTDIYCFSFSEDVPEYELSCMMEIYKKIS